MKPSTYKNYMLIVLMIILASNYADRHVLGLLLQDIKIDLALSDTQMGLLSGIAFALFYSIVGIPIARWADRGNRVAIIAIATSLWSVAVALCGMAGNFFQLLLIRVSVGVGEAGFAPPAHSLIADYFNRVERPRAVAIFKLGTSLSLVFGYLLAGWLNELYGWRMTFVLMGLPGVALAVLAKLTLQEPRTRPTSGAPDASSSARSRRKSARGRNDSAQPSMREVLVTLWANLTFRHLLLAWSIVIMFGAGIGKWQPAFFIRSHGLHTGELGVWLAAVAGGGGLLGTYLGGVLASRYAANNERLQLKFMAIAFSTAGILYAGIFLVPSAHLAFFMMALAFIIGCMVTGPLFATIQTLVPERMRAMSVAIIFLFANLIGTGLGPLAVGALSDVLHPMLGTESLRYALAILCPGYFWCGWHFWRASKTVMQDLKAAESAAGRVAREREVPAGVDMSGPAKSLG